MFITIVIIVIALCMKGAFWVKHTCTMETSTNIFTLYKYHSCCSPFVTPARRNVANKVTVMSPILLVVGCIHKIVNTLEIQWMQ